jgi:protein SCO1/2
MFSFRKVVSFVIVAGLAGAWLGCSENKPAAPQSAAASANTSTQIFEVKGVVQKLDEDGKTISIKHEKIPGYMEAMTMPFEVRNTNELAGIKPGDELLFKMLVTTNDGWIENLRKTGTTNAVAPVQHQSVRLVREVNPVVEGDPLPNYAFTNELGKRIEFADYKGSAIGFTFIFTRCPFPNFCPRMSSNFLEVSKRLAAQPGLTNWHLFSISFDPEFDTPERLKAYASRYDRDLSRWNFLTGAMIDIDAITEQFGLGFAWRQGTIDHNLRTVIVDANGKVRKIYIGNEWKVEEFVAEMTAAARNEARKL